MFSAVNPRRDGYALVAIAEHGFELIEGGRQPSQVLVGPLWRDVDVDGWQHRHIPKLHGEATDHHVEHSVIVEGVDHSRRIDYRESASVTSDTTQSGLLDPATLQFL